MRAKEYQLLVRAVEEGIARGFRRAYKHLEEEPPNDEIQCRIAEEVINAICEAFTFDDEDKPVEYTAVPRG